MPTYDFHCTKCNKVFELVCSYEVRKEQSCKCGQKADVLLASPMFARFEEAMWEHIGPSPVRISDRRQLKEQCKRNGCYSPAYMDGTDYGKEI